MGRCLTFLSFFLLLSPFLGGVELPASFGEGCFLTDQFLEIKNLSKKKRWKQLKKLYDSFLEEKEILQEGDRIPKIIHQIWLGSDFPEVFKSYRQSILDHHPDWTYILWTEDEIESLGLEKEALYRESKNYGEKSDIARYEILNRMGGVYVDVDVKSLKPFDFFCERTTFFVGVSSKIFDSPFINNAVIGASPGHPVLRKCLDLITTVRKDDEPVMRIIKTTGPKILEKALFESLPCSKPIVVCPTIFFYPLPVDRRQIADEDEMWIRPESFTIHYSHMSWVKEDLSN